MRFLIISPVIHKKFESSYGGYAPYIKEMNIWLKYTDFVHIVAPLSDEPLDPLESLYEHQNLKFIKVPAINFTELKKAIKSLFALPLIFFVLFREMIWATHIHLRCPSNMGLLGSFAQICFPQKPKTAKYANNWDWKSQQSATYRIQQKLLRSQFWTKNMKILVYGDWNEKSKNVLPFFTASYSKTMDLPTKIRTLSSDKEICLLFVGTITENKRPLIAVKTMENLINRGFNVHIDLIGGGAQTQEIKEYVVSKQLDSFISIHGKMNPDDVIKYYQSAHFLVFLSMSEGWPKVVSEAMWWGCLPITTNVSCVKQMVGDGQRGILIEPEPNAAADVIVDLTNNPNCYNKMCNDAIEWARQYHFERFEKEIVGLLKEKKVI